MLKPGNGPRQTTPADSACFKHHRSSPSSPSTNIPNNNNTTTTAAAMSLQPPTSPFVPFSPNPALQSGTPSATTPLSITQKPPPVSSASLRYASTRRSIYDRNLNRTQRAELSKASFAFLFGEMIQYAQKRVSGIQDLEKKYDSPIRFSEFRSTLQ